MMWIVGVAIFSGALAVALYAIHVTIGENIDRILDALAGRPKVDFCPLARLARAEQQIAVRRWAAQGRPARAQLQRAAA